MWHIDGILMLRKRQATTTQVTWFNHVWKNEKKWKDINERYEDDPRSKQISF